MADEDDESRLGHVGQLGLVRSSQQAVYLSDDWRSCQAGLSYNIGEIKATMRAKNGGRNGFGGGNRVAFLLTKEHQTIWADGGMSQKSKGKKKLQTGSKCRMSNPMVGSRTGKPAHKVPMTGEQLTRQPIN